MSEVTLATKSPLTPMSNSSARPGWASAKGWRGLSISPASAESPAERPGGGERRRSRRRARRRAAGWRSEPAPAGCRVLQLLEAVASSCSQALSRTARGSRRAGGGRPRARDERVSDLLGPRRAGEVAGPGDSSKEQDGPRRSRGCAWHALRSAKRGTDGAGSGRRAIEAERGQAGGRSARRVGERRRRGRGRATGRPARPTHDRDRVAGAGGTRRGGGHAPVRRPAAAGSRGCRIRAPSDPRGPAGWRRRRGPAAASSSTGPTRARASARRLWRRPGRRSSHAR